MINGGFIGKIICKWAMFHGYVKLPEGKSLCCEGVAQIELV